MEVIVLENEKTRLKLEIKGEGNTLCNAIKKELWNDKNIEIAGYHIEHSQTTDPILVVEVNKGEAKKALLDAVDRLKKINKEFRDKSKAL
jgi:DNA-directed RNA polymerase subunit L